jgi:DNA gyrase subunit A
VVREHQELVLISQNGMVQRTGVRGINRYGRTSQGVRVMNLREGDEVSAVALIVETEAPASTASDEPVSLIDENGSDHGVVATDPLDDPEGEN